jgi:hypothetical protein
MDLISDYIIIGFAATVGHAIANTIIGIINTLLFILFAPKPPSAE